MKEASGEASNTVITIILIAAILAAATLIITAVTKNIKTKSAETSGASVDLIDGGGKVTKGTTSD